MDELKQLGFKDLSYLMHPGIYVLCLNGKVVYVGQTTTLFSRISLHIYKEKTQFDKIYFAKCLMSELDRLEALMILKLKPERQTAYNFNKNTDPGHKPIYGEASPISHTINVRGVELSIKGKSAFRRI